jgi:hypothetical protein
MVKYHISYLCRDMVCVNLPHGETNDDWSQGRSCDCGSPSGAKSMRRGPALPHWFNDFRSWLSEHGAGFYGLVTIFWPGL